MAFSHQIKLPFCRTMLLHAALFVLLILFALPAGAETLRNLAGERLLIGTAVDMNALGGQGIYYDPLYDPTLAAEFSLVTPETWLKMMRVHPTNTANDLTDFSDLADYDFSRLDELAAFARAHNMKIRGQPLIWHKNLPDWLTDGLAQGLYNREDLLAIFEDHVRTVVRYGASLKSADGSPLIVSWDVINEPIGPYGSIRDEAFWSIIGGGDLYSHVRKLDFIRRAFEWARQEDSQAQLFMNECGAEEMFWFSDSYHQLAADLLTQGAPLQGVGFQMHVAVDIVLDLDRFLDEWRANMARFSALGLKIQVTEMDVRFQEPYGTDMDQAMVFGRILEACLEEPNFIAFSVWGLTDKHTFLERCIPGLNCTGAYWSRADFPGPLLISQEYVPKAAYHAVNYVLSR